MLIIDCMELEMWLPPNEIGHGVQLWPALSGMDGVALIVSASADATVRLWRSKCWSCLRIFSIAPGVSQSPPLPFLSTALSPE